MESSSSKPSNKRLRSVSPPKESSSNSKRSPYEFYDVSQKVWDISNFGKFAIEMLLIDQYTKIIAKLEARIVNDKKAIERRKKQVIEYQQRIKDVKKQIQDYNCL